MVPYLAVHKKCQNYLVLLQPSNLLPTEGRYPFRVTCPSKPCCRKNLSMYCLLCVSSLRLSACLCRHAHARALPQPSLLPLSTIACRPPSMRMGRKQSPKAPRLPPPPPPPLSPPPGRCNRPFPCPASAFARLRSLIAHGWLEDELMSRPLCSNQMSANLSVCLLLGVVTCCCGYCCCHWRCCSCCCYCGWCCCCWCLYCEGFFRQKCGSRDASRNRDPRWRAPPSARP